MGTDELWWDNKIYLSIVVILDISHLYIYFQGSMCIIFVILLSLITFVRQLSESCGPAGIVLWLRMATAGCAKASGVFLSAVRLSSHQLCYRSFLCTWKAYISTSTNYNPLKKKKQTTFIIKIYSLFLDSYNLSCIRVMLFGWKAIRKTWKYTARLLTPNRKLSIYGGGLLSEWMDTYELN